MKTKCGRLSRPTGLELKAELSPFRADAFGRFSSSSRGKPRAWSLRRWRYRVQTIIINIYRSGGAWFGARWIGGEYDGCDELDVAGDASADDARDAAMAMPLTAQGEREVQRVADR